MSTGTNGSDDETASSSSISLTVADGELGTLLDSLEEPSILPLTPELSTSLRSVFAEDYGRPLSVEEAVQAIPLCKNSDHEEEGQVWNATVIPNEFMVGENRNQLRRGLTAKDFDLTNGRIKLRRASLPLTQTDLISSLTRIPAPDNRYIFHGVLNGWPALTTFELISLSQKRDLAVIPSPKDLVLGRLAWTPVWRAGQDNQVSPASVMDPNRVYKAELRAAAWSAKGWSSTSRGFCFWFEAQTDDIDQDTGHPIPRLSYGTNMLQTLDDTAHCTHVHMMSHRYARLRENPRDRLTYHSVCLLEWQHGKYCTVVESAYLNGMGGYKGKSNWYDDKDEELTVLYRSLPPEMVAPWRPKSAEIRCYDIACKSHEEFKEFVMKYAGKDKRFIDPHFHFSHPARLTFRSKRHIAQYLINYISRDTAYAELQRNCQTFVADLGSFLAGKRQILPFHPVSRVEYSNRTYLFLYDSYMYDSRAKKAKAKQQKQKQQQQ